jgi:hypothetical protein
MPRTAEDAAAERSRQTGAPVRLADEAARYA